MTSTFRDVAWRLSPARLRTYRAARMVYSFFGVQLDAVAEASSQATKARFPELCPEDALPYHGRDRVIVRGPSEAADVYRRRLLLWLESWRGAGVGRAMLDQIAGYIAPQPVRLRLWTQLGVVYTREPAGTFFVERVPGLWDWDGNTSLWARFWIIIYSPDGVPWSRDGEWGDGEAWGSSSTSSWGSTARVGDVQAIRGIVGDWKPAASVCKNIIVSFDALAFDPNDTAPPLPDGTWEHWSVNFGGTQIPARNNVGIYWDGVS